MANPAETVFERVRDVGIARLILPGIALAILLQGLFSGGFGLVEIEPGEAAVVYNTTGLSLFGDKQRVIREQGTFTFIPFVQRVERLDIRPQVLLMEGDADTDANHVKRLSVRAVDGSRLWFDRLEIHYQTIPELADKVIAHHGKGDAYKELALAVHSREVLRNEFGLYTFLKLADPSAYGVATAQAKEILNRRLEPYGLAVTQIITPKPRFRPEVEKAIEDRQNAEQEVEVQKEKRQRMLQQKERQIRDVRQTKNGEEKALLAQLEGAKKEAENRAVATRREADKYSIQTTAQCEADRDAMITRAKANEEAYRKDAEALAAKIEAVGSRGADVLNLEIAQHVFPQLEKISAVPYSNPSTPIDIRHIDKGGN
jgi:regulator of protease activity HflC (stomatin/prohibitin superfamily)